MFIVPAVSEYDNTIHEPCRYGRRHNGKSKTHITEPKASGYGMPMQTLIYLTEEFENHDRFMLKLMGKLPWTSINIRPESQKIMDHVATALFSANSVDLFFYNRHFGRRSSDERVGAPPCKVQHLRLIVEMRKFHPSNPGAELRLCEFLWRMGYQLCDSVTFRNNYFCFRCCQSTSGS